MAVAVVASGMPATATATESERDYLVVSTSQHQQPVTASVAAVGGEVVSSLAAVGASVAELTPSEAARLDTVPGVVVSPDGPVSVGSGGLSTAPRKPDGRALVQGDDVVVAAKAGETSASRTARSWGIDRIDRRSGLNGTYTTRPGVNGAGVHVYVIDTGLALGHPEFAGRVGNGVDFVDGGAPTDCNGHGTHVAGIVASKIFGVAAGATVHPVRVLDCDGSGYASDVIAAFDWVATNAPRAAVANASLGGSYNPAVNAAANNLVDRGTPLVVAGGNQGSDVSFFSPASAERVTTVISSNRYDRDSWFSNYGEEVDLYAPGEEIWSTYYLDPARMMRMSGTSMAAPHVAGYMALRLQVAPTESPAATVAALKSHSTKNVISDAFGGSPDDLLYTYAVARPLQITASAVSNRSRIGMNVNPNLGAGSWAVSVQRRSGSTWRTVWTGRTSGSGETATVNVSRGTYRAVVRAGQYGYTRSAVSNSVTILR
jgi:subtilisin family serine protease